MGASNLLFLALLLEDLKERRERSEIASWVLAVEEPEAHLHPHLQRVVFRYLFLTSDALILTTNSPQIISVAPLDALVRLCPSRVGSTASRAAPDLLTARERDDIERYLDAVRADFLFARGVILVEGAAEVFLIPAFARKLGLSFDELGITVCPVYGTQFHPYRKALAEPGFGIPNVVVTDGDPVGEADGERINGLSRGLELIPPDVARPETGDPTVRGYLANAGIYVGETTLETDIARVAPEALVAAFSELVPTQLRADNFRSAVDRYVADPTPDNGKAVLSRIDSVGKGRVAQRLAAYQGALPPPQYIAAAIARIVEDAARSG